MRAPDPFPTAIDLVRAENALHIEWEDGSRSTLSGATLRWACPCAECRGEMGVPGRLDRADDLPEDEMTLENAELIGQYALQIAFRSGHATGIYTFPTLRGLGEDR
ncbi:MAG: gamma-butyrobetaine hydroxylase-like domain-containing protein [Candidatus Dormibacteraceae bacterium]